MSQNRTKAHRELLDRIRKGAAHATGMLSQDDPLFGPCEAAFRRGVMHGVVMVERHFDLPDDIRKKIYDYAYREIYRWRFSFTDQCKPEPPPYPK